MDPIKVDVYLLDHVKVGALRFGCSEIDDLRDGDQKLNGWIKCNDLQVLVDRDLADDVKVVTVWHEILHGLIEQAGFDDHDERLITALSFGLHQVLKDNPDLVGLYR